MNLKRITLPLMATLWGLNAAAADIAGLTVKGEASFDYNFLSSGDNAYPASGGALNEQYRFNQAQLQLTKETDELSFLARLNYQPTTYETGAGTAKANIGTLDQIELYYKFTPEFSVGFGRLCSTMGFESILKSENIFYNNSLAYQLIVPGYGEGMRARYAPGEWLTVSLSTYNRTTYNYFGDDYTSTKTTEVSATGVAGRFLWFAGYQWGTDGDGTAPNPKVDKKISNAWATYKLSDDFLLSAIYDNRAQKQEGSSEIFTQSITGQVSYAFQWHTLGVRYEYLLGAGELDALNGITTPTNYRGADKVQIWSVVDKFNLSEHFNLYVEYRHDGADQAVLKNNKGDDTKDAHMITLGALAHF